MAHSKEQNTYCLTLKNEKKFVTVVSKRNTVYVTLGNWAKSKIGGTLNKYLYYKGN